MQIQALIAREVAGAERGTMGSNIGSQMKVAKPPMFNREVGKVRGFITVYRLYLRIKMRKVAVEEQA